MLRSAGGKFFDHVLCALASVAFVCFVSIWEFYVLIFLFCNWYWWICVDLDRSGLIEAFLMPWKKARKYSDWVFYFEVVVSVEDLEARFSRDLVLIYVRLVYNGAWLENLIVAFAEFDCGARNLAVRRGIKGWAMGLCSWKCAFIGWIGGFSPVCS